VVVPTKGVEMKKFATVVLAVFAVGFLVGGAYAVSQGREATNDVRERIVAQNIITSEDAAIPGVLVDSADTAVAQGDVIGVHADEAVTEMLGEPLTYAEIPYQDATDAEVAARALLEQAAGLRSALYGTAAAFKLAELVTWLGAAFAALGLLFGFGAVYVHKS